MSLMSYLFNNRNTYWVNYLFRQIEFIRFIFRGQCIIPSIVCFVQPCMYFMFYFLNLYQIVKWSYGLFVLLLRGSWAVFNNDQLLQIRIISSLSGVRTRGLRAWSPTVRHLHELLLYRPKFTLTKHLIYSLKSVS